MLADEALDIRDLAVGAGSKRAWRGVGFIGGGGASGPA